MFCFSLFHKFSRYCEGQQSEITHALFDISTLKSVILVTFFSVWCVSLFIEQQSLQGSFQKLFGAMSFSKVLVLNDNMERQSLFIHDSFKNIKLKNESSTITFQKFEYNYILLKKV